MSKLSVNTEWGKTLAKVTILQAIVEPDNAELQKEARKAYEDLKKFGYRVPKSAKEWYEKS